MHERPQAALFQALRQLGYRVDSPNDKLPAVIHGTGPRPGKCKVSIEESSQFASALLMCSVVAGWQVEIVGENARGVALYLHDAGDVFVFSLEQKAQSASGIRDEGWHLPR